MRQVNHSTEDMVPFILTQLKDSPVWKYRRDAAKLLMHLGNVLIEMHETYSIVGL